MKKTLDWHQQQLDDTHGITCPLRRIVLTFFPLFWTKGSRTNLISPVFCFCRGRSSSPFRKTKSGSGVYGTGTATTKMENRRRPQRKKWTDMIANACTWSPVGSLASSSISYRATRTTLQYNIVTVPAFLANFKLDSSSHSRKVVLETGIAVLPHLLPSFFDIRIEKASSIGKEIVVLPY
eukprot:scaffold5125_cov156-Amphora_coffeaeformis.AAC.3